MELWVRIGTFPSGRILTVNRKREIGRKILVKRDRSSDGRESILVREGKVNKFERADSEREKERKKTNSMW